MYFFCYCYCFGSLLLSILAKPPPPPPLLFFLFLLNLGTLPVSEYFLFLVLRTQTGVSFEVNIHIYICDSSIFFPDLKRLRVHFSFASKHFRENLFVCLFVSLFHLPAPHLLFLCLLFWNLFCSFYAYIYA